MGFSGGGSNVTKAHTHDSNIVQDGGSLAANVTQFGLTAGSILYSDGSNIQELAVGSAADTLTVNGAATAPEWAAGSAGVWTANGTATASTVQAQLEVTGISNTPDIVQVLFNVAGDGLSHLALRINDVQTSTYYSRVLGFYNAFDYDAFNTKTEFWVDRESNNESRCGCIWLFKPNSNFGAAGNVGWCFRAEDTETGLEPSYITMSGGGNQSITVDMTSIQVLFDSANIMGNIQVNSMTYQ